MADDPYRLNNQTRLIQGVTRLHQALDAAGKSLLRGKGLSLAQRGIMESLWRDGPSPVPALARTRPVSRQHVQGLVDALIEAGLVEARPNPAHRRSNLIALTAKGETTYGVIRWREAGPTAALFDGIADADIEATIRTLETLRTRAAALARKR